MIKKDGRGAWRTTTFNEGDHFGTTGDSIRVIAGAYVYKNLQNSNPQVVIIVLGGKGQLRRIPDAPAVSTVIKKELIVLGVPAKNIIKEQRSNNTYEQLNELKKIIAKYRFKVVGIISNAHHFPRVKAMMKYSRELTPIKNLADIKFLPAEKIVIKYGSYGWKKIIANAYKSTAMKKRIALEQRGLAEIKKGLYKFTGSLIERPKIKKY